MAVRKNPRFRGGVFPGWGGVSLVFLCLLALGSIAQAQECEIPIFVQQSVQGANVMILADNSASMNMVLYHAGYDASVTYAGSFIGGSTYFVAKAGSRTPYDFNPTYPDEPSANLVVSDNGQNGRYSGNYLNWIYFNATDIQRNAIPEITRIQVLKEILGEIITQSSARLRFGLTVFNNESGGNIIGKCGVNPVSLQAQIDGITANTWTPMGEALETILDYYSYDGPDAAIEEWCQFNFVLVITDGMPTMDLDVSAYLWDADGDGNDPGDCESIGAPYTEDNNCSDHCDDVAYYMAHEDLRPDMEDNQHANTYVVGFHENGTLLHETAENGGGLFFHAENSVELFLSIEYAIQDIMKKISAGSAVAVVSTEEGADDRLYRGKFMPIDWTGFLECHNLPYQDSNQPLWEAGEVLRQRDPDSRDIFTALGSTRYSFHESNTFDLEAAMGAADEAEAARLIAWGRGENVEGMRDRHGWILGDIIHSTPVVVGAPSGFLAETGYQAFYIANAARQKMVYIEANDGMLHAFNADSGVEEWAFVPEFALPTFSTMADSFYCHTYTCDQTPSIKDIKLGQNWETVLVSTGGRGGASLFALSITDPDNPRVLWQQDLPDGMRFTSEVEITNIGGESVAMVGSGLNDFDAKAYMHCYLISSGTYLGSIELSTLKTRNKATRPEVVDFNMDSQADLVYIADLSGTMWRVEINDTINMGLWDVSALYTGDQEITADPVAACGQNGAIYVYFGTGSYLTEDDMLTVDQNYFVCVYDDHDGSTESMKTLRDQTDSIDAIDGAQGWYVALWNKPGERVTKQATVVAETAIFTSFAPTLDACAAGGESWIYQMRYDTGSTDELEGMTDLLDRSVSLGDGLASYPVVDLAQGQVVVQSSSANIQVQNIAAMYRQLVVKSWREDF